MVTARRKPGRLLTEEFGLSFSQADVDFVVPDLAGDLRLGIDPFLLFKSRDAAYKAAHDRLLSVFNSAINAFAAGEIGTSRKLIDFPEVNEIGFGYRETSDRGSGMGAFLNELLMRTLGESPALVKRGVRHVEEMQLVTLGINADRVSDIAGNILKQFLIDYTQRQADRFGIPITKGVPVSHVFDFEDWEWRDDYYDLPLNTLTKPNRPILLVPRRIVRVLPWINFGDYQRTEFGLYLRAKRIQRGLKESPHPPSARPSKEEIVAVSRSEVERIDHYVDLKERDARRALPEMLVPVTSEFVSVCDELITELRALHTGQKDAYRYQELMFRTLNLLFEPDLIEGRQQVRTEHGTEIRDILYTNDSDKRFWEFVRSEHHSLTIVFECKNTNSPDNRDIDQLAGYLGDSLGYFGIILTREPLSDSRRLKCISWFNKGAPHRLMIHLDDGDIIRMLEMRKLGRDPTEIVRLRYQDFRSTIQ
jgi:hypothetical protein